ncbi:MAG TPA: DoxX family membrane protein [Opitutus sp.]|nr:DoxX family membrane protein [Opitutus sp.]
MKYLPTIARVLLGLMFFAFGLMGFLVKPPEGGVPEGAMALSDAMMKSGYLFQLIKGTEIVCGLLLLVNRFVPLALTVLAPVILNILLFHAFLAPSGMVIPIVILGLELYLAWAYRHAFRPMLGAKVSPA